MFSMQLSIYLQLPQS